jgi:hypothetical protein
MGRSLEALQMVARRACGFAPWQRWGGLGGYSITERFEPGDRYLQFRF